MKIRCILLFVIFTSFSLKGQQTNEKFVLEIDYLLYLPKDYEQDISKNWPLLLFLHGSGEQGDDLKKVKVHGPPMRIEQGHEFPFIVVSPQAKRGWSTDMLYKMLQGIIGEQRVDTDRVYLTGLSMGGYGTWELAMQHPEMFAAIVPICGGGNPSDVWKLRHTPVWCLHGEKDDIVPLSSSKIMVDALKEYNEDVRFTIYPDVGHDSWIKAYNDPELYEWILQQKKFKFKKIDLPSQEYDDYVGEYLIDGKNFKDTLKITNEEGKLFGQVKMNRFLLKPSSKTTFFLDENQLFEIRFKRNDQGVIESIKLFVDEILVAKRI